MEVRVSAGACLLVGWFAVVNGWHLTGLVLSAAALHELGHLAALRLLGGAVTALRISVFGAELAAEGGQLSYGRELAAVLAGPLTNLLAGLALARLGRDAEALEEYRKDSACYPYLLLPYVGQIGCLGRLGRTAEIPAVEKRLAEIMKIRGISRAGLLRILQDPERDKPNSL